MECPRNYVEFAIRVRKIEMSIDYRDKSANQKINTKLLLYDGYLSEKIKCKNDVVNNRFIDYLFTAKSVGELEKVENKYRYFFASKPAEWIPFRFWRNDRIFIYILLLFKFVLKNYIHNFRSSRLQEAHVRTSNYNNGTRDRQINFEKSHFPGTQPSHHGNGSKEAEIRTGKTGFSTVRKI